MFGALPGSPNENWNQAVAALVRELCPGLMDGQVEDVVLLATEAYQKSTLRGIRFEVAVSIEQVLNGRPRERSEAIITQMASESGDPLHLFGYGNGCRLCGAPRAEYDPRYCADCRDVVSLFERSGVTLRMGGV